MNTVKDEFRMLDELPKVSALGACLCTSFSYDVKTGACKVCLHESHASRVHCGVMVNA